MAHGLEIFNTAGVSVFNNSFIYNRVAAGTVYVAAFSSVNISIPGMTTSDDWMVGVINECCGYIYSGFLFMPVAVNDDVLIDVQTKITKYTDYFNIYKGQSGQTIRYFVYAKGVY